MHDTSQEVLRSVEKTSKDLETFDRSFQKVMQYSEVQTESTNESRGSVQASAELKDETSGGLTDIKIVEKKLEHITDLLMESRISSPPTSPSTIASSCEVSAISVMNSPQETATSNILSRRSNPSALSQDARQANIMSEHPLLQFKNNQVRSNVHAQPPI